MKNHKTAKHETHEYVARIATGPSAGLFLRRTPAGWGPEFFLTDSLLDATRWDTVPFNKRNMWSPIWSSEDNIDFVSVKVIRSVSIMKD